MATRQRALRGDESKEFVGKVRKWRREWLEAGTDAKGRKLKMPKWRPLDEGVEPQKTNIYSKITPVPNPNANKVQRLPSTKPQKLTVKLKMNSAKGPEASEISLGQAAGNAAALMAAADAAPPEPATSMRPPQ